MDLVHVTQELAPYVGGAWGVRKVFGPSLDVVGTSVAEVTQATVDRIEHVLRAGRDRLSARDDQPGDVSERSLRRIVEVATSQDDDLVLEYLGGVLASSKVSGVRDDRGASWGALIDGLSSYALRTHYIAYMCLRKELLDRQLSYNSADVPNIQLFISLTDYAQSMALDKEEPLALTTYVVSVLVKESLISPTYGQDEGKPVQAFKGSRGMFISPSILGIQLFMWGLGYGDLPLESYVDPALDIVCHPDIDLPPTKLTRPFDEGLQESTGDIPTRRG